MSKDIVFNTKIAKLYIISFNLVENLIIILENLSVFLINACHKDTFLKLTLTDFHHKINFLNIIKN